MSINVYRCLDFTLNSCHRGGSRNFWLGWGGGGPNFGSERTVELFWGKLLFPHTPSHQWWLHVIIPWPLTVYLDSTCKGCTLGSSSSCVWLQRLYRFRQHQCQGHDVSARARTWARTYVRTYVYTYIHTYIHTYINAYIHTYIHTYKLYWNSLQQGFSVTIN